MKAIFRILFTISLLVPAACNTNNPQSTRAASEDVTDRMKAERNEYVNGIEARLAEFDQKIDGLEKRADAMTGTLKTNFKNSIDDLKNERKAVDVKLDDLKKVSIESWTTLKLEVDAAMANLDRSYTRVSETYEIPGAPQTPKSKTY